MKLGNVLAALPTLSPAELAAVRAAADRLLGTDEPQNPLYAQLQGIAGVRTPYRTFAKTKAGKSLLDAERDFNTFIDANWHDLNRVSRHAVTAYLLSLLTDDLKQRQIPVSLTSLTFSLGQVERVFDQAWPGYRKNNLCPMILKAVNR